MNVKRFTSANIILALIILYFVVSFILYPLYSLLKESFLDSNGSLNLNSYVNIFSSTSLKATYNSILLSIFTVIGSAIVGIYFAYIFQYHKIPLKSFFTTLLLIPLATPPLIGVVAFLFLLNEKLKMRFFGFEFCLLH